MKLSKRNERRQSIAPRNEILLKKPERRKSVQINDNKVKEKKMLYQEKEIIQHNDLVQEKEKQVPIFFFEYAN